MNVTYAVKRFSLLVCVAAFAFPGCSSFETTMMGRSSDGKYSACNNRLKGRGVPLKLKVPSHLEVTIVETVLMDKDSGEVLQTEKRILDIESEMKYTDQMFLVDLARPIAGNVLANDSNNKGFEIDGDGYLSALSVKVEDKTITDFSEVLTGDAAKAFLTSTRVTGGQGILSQKGTIAVRRFDITQPNWHDWMNDWVNEIVQKCAGKCLAPTCEGCATTDQPVPVPESGGKTFLIEAPADVPKK